MTKAGRRENGIKLSLEYSAAGVSIVTGTLPAVHRSQGLILHRHWFERLYEWYSSIAVACEVVVSL